MALLSEDDELGAAWRALEGAEQSAGWRTIRIARDCPSPLMAGRWFPENQEALLIGFAPAAVRVVQKLPQGRGFEVSKADLGLPAGRYIWVALRRHSAGRLDLFTVMARDVIAILIAARDVADAARLQILLARIRAWQEFMRSETDGCLDPEAEVGLFGELEVLEKLVTAGVSPTVALDAWRGPLAGPQDFVLGAGAIEAKTTAAPAGFLATIRSLEQLDDSLVRPIFIAAVRVALDVSGETLPERVARLRDVCAGDPVSVATLGHLLLHAGFNDATACDYTRRFVPVSMRLLRVSDAFPRVTRATVRIEIRSAQYVIDLDLIEAEPVEILPVLKELGVVTEWS